MTDIALVVLCAGYVGWGARRRTRSRACVSRFRFVLVRVFVLVGVLVSARAFGEDPYREPYREAQESLSTAKQDAEKQFGHLDWEGQREGIERALETIWKDNGWSDESDRFALAVARDTSAIPPWQPMQRIDLMVDRFRQRYEISEEDAAGFKRKIILEVGGFLGRHAATLFKQARTSLDLQGGAASMAPEKVADMVKEIEPIRADALAMIDRLIVDIEGIAPESAKETILGDIRSFRKREVYIDGMIERWKRGEWKPRDWGLPEGPNPQGPEPGDSAGGVADSQSQKESDKDAKTRPVITVCVPHDPSTWFVYVRDFQKRYNLDAAQVTSARSIENELVSRGMVYRDSHKKELAEVPPVDRPTHAAFAPILAMFDDLRERLDAVPTSGQREPKDR